MSRPRPSLSTILVLILALASTAIFSGCASKDADKPWKKSEPKWYDSDMSSDERSFFFGSFFSNSGR